MRLSDPALVLFLAAPFAFGCGVEPICSAEVGRPGSAIALCSSVDERAVCDDPGMVAEYQRDDLGRLVLVGGTLASCNDEEMVVCPDGETVARCIVQPAAE